MSKFIKSTSMEPKGKTVMWKNKDINQRLFTENVPVPRPLESGDCWFRQSLIQKRVWRDVL